MPTHRDRPNILLIVSDQHRYDCVRANGHALLRTPHLDRLAGEGINFTHAFCPAPVCVPSRISLLCGQWPARHGAIANFDTEAGRPMPPDATTWSALLNAAGYWLGHVGRWHIHPKKPPTDFGFHEHAGLEGYEHWRREQGIPLMKFDDWSWFFGRADPHISADQSRPAWSADQVIRMMETAARGTAPFLLHWELGEPHLPNLVPEPFASMYRPEDIPPWPGFADPLVGKPFIQRQQRRTWGIDGWPWERWARTVALYLGEVSLIDAQVGRVLGALDRLGLRETTLVIYTTDHGDLCGSHGMIDKHYVMYDDVVRVPLMARWPGVAAPGRACDAFVSHALDLAATLCDAAGLPVPGAFQGSSLVPILAGREAGTGRDDIFAAYYGNQMGLYSQRMVRDRRWKYVWNATAEDELYDLVSDAGELVNQAGSESGAEELKRLRARLVSWMEITGDRLLNGWTRRQLVGGAKP